MAKDRDAIIAGVDFGTTFSGLDYTPSGGSHKDIEIIRHYPGTSDVVAKTPSLLAYPEENGRSFKGIKWGYTVTPSMLKYWWFKLLLDGNTQISDYDDPALNDLYGSGMLSLPAGKSAEEVCTDYLRELYEHLVAHLCKKYSNAIYEITPIQFWITVPAIWSDTAKNATRAASLSAGFGSRACDTVNIIPEPEAAALAALKPYISDSTLDPIQPEENILICDCGGGTVDLTAYSILSCQPKLIFKELCVGSGGKCGSTYIDRNFNTWMTNTFGKAYTSLPLKKRGPGSLFMRSFEVVKRAFRGYDYGARGTSYIEIEPINMDTPRSEHYDPDEATVKLTWYTPPCYEIVGHLLMKFREEMKDLFEPAVQGIIRLIKAQIGDAKKRKQNFKRIILVGGFGDSDYLNDRLKLWCGAASIHLTCPPQSQAAVVRGAVIRGLEKSKPLSRLARRHYGYDISMRFRERIDPERKSYIDIFDGKKLCEGRMDWRISKGQEMDESTVMRSGISVILEKGQRSQTVDLWCCASDFAPEYSDHHTVQQVGSVQLTFVPGTIKSAHRRRHPTRNGYLVQVEVDIEVHMETEEGVLRVKAFVHEKEIGNAVIEFHQT